MMMSVRSRVGRMVFGRNASRISSANKVAMSKNDVGCTYFLAQQVAAVHGQAGNDGTTTPGDSSSVGKQSSSSMPQSSQQKSWKSSVAAAADVKEQEEMLDGNAAELIRDLRIEVATEESEQQEGPLLQQQHTDSTYSRSKAGTPSPWAVFDAWGAGCDDTMSKVNNPLSPEMERMLQNESVKIPMTEEERGELPGETDILDAYNELLQRKSSIHFGYPYNLMYDHSELFKFMQYSINNLGDPFVPSNYGVHSRQFECSVIDFFANLWKMKPDSYWGYVTTSGTEGNLHGILLARECHPDAMLYTSQETHYSVFKAARYYRMDCTSIPTLPMGEIDYDLLSQAIDKNIDRPIIINVNVGTTVKGAVDNLDRILRILKMKNIPRDRFHIHCDGALFALMMPFIDYAPQITFEKPIDSIAVSGHKMLGCPMPCGIALCRKEHVEKVEEHIDYLNSVDTTIMGSRNGQAALYLWYSLRKKGIAGIKRDVLHCMETAQYLKNKISEAGLTCRVNDLSSTVVLERPMDEQFVKRWQLACEEDIAHVVVMPNVTRHKIDHFVEELVACKNKYGRIQPVRENSPLIQLTSNAWGGSEVIQPHAFAQSS